VRTVFFSAWSLGVGFGRKTAVGQWFRAERLYERAGVAEVAGPASHLNRRQEMTDIALGKSPDLLVELTADIVAAYVSNHVVPVSDLSNLIADVHTALSNTSSPAPVVAAIEKPKPPVPIKKSIEDDYLICLEDGQKFKSLKRHLMTHYNMTPEEYREKWGLPADYPMVAPAYAEARSRLAKEMGLGQRRKRAKA
jgi:predicted transcriptional regulator